MTENWDDEKFEQKNVPDDYLDEEGYLCCGICGARKECCCRWPVLDGSGKTVEKKVRILCTCQKEHIEKRETERKNREHLELVSQLRKTCFTSHEMNSHTFENAGRIPPDIIEKAKIFVDQWPLMKKENTGYLFWGDCGTGKSYTAACIANSLMEKEISVLMRNMGDFLNMNWEEKREISRDIARYGLVIFDDFGMERKSEYSQEIIFQVINARCESGKPTIITTNLSLQELMNPPDMVHKRIYERILEMCIPIQFKGPSVRMEVHKGKMNFFRRILTGGR